MLPGFASWQGRQAGLWKRQRHGQKSPCSSCLRPSRPAERDGQAACLLRRDALPGQGSPFLHSSVCQSLPARLPWPVLLSLAGSAAGEACQVLAEARRSCRERQQAAGPAGQGLQVREARPVRGIRQQKNQLRAAQEKADQEQAASWVLCPRQTARQTTRQTARLQVRRTETRAGVKPWGLPGPQRPRIRLAEPAGLADFRPARRWELPAVRIPAAGQKLSPGQGDVPAVSSLSEALQPVLQTGRPGLQGTLPAARHVLRPLRLSEPEAGNGAEIETGIGTGAGRNCRPRRPFPESGRQTCPGGQGQTVRLSGRASVCQTGFGQPESRARARAGCQSTAPPGQGTRQEVRTVRPGQGAG